MQIAWDDAPYTGFTTGKAAALLCYLAVTGRPHARAHLATLLWGGLAEEGARSNLRVTLSNLRREFAAYLIITREMRAFNPDAPPLLDVRSLSGLRPAHADAPPDEGALRTAVEF